MSSWRIKRTSLNQVRYFLNHDHLPIDENVSNVFHGLIAEGAKPGQVLVKKERVIVAIPDPGNTDE
jgi:hypothetical protein